MKTLIKRMGMAVVVGAVMLAGGRALAANSYWQSVGGVYDGNYTNTPNWNAAPPGAADWAYFTNHQSSAYTVTLTKSVTDGPLTVYDDQVNFNLNGYTWRNVSQNWGGSGTMLGTSNTTTAVKFYSTSAGANTVYLGVGAAGTDYWVGSDTLGTEAPTVHHVNSLARSTTVTVDDSGGYPVTLHYGSSGGIGDVNLVVSGTGSTLRLGYNLGANGGITIKDGAIFQAYPYYLYIGNSCMWATTMVVNASLKSVGAFLGTGSPGWGSQGTLILSNNSTWTDASTATVGASSGGSYYTGKHSGEVLVDGSTIVGQNMVIGAYGDYDGVGKVQVLNGSSMTLSNGLLLSAISYNVGALHLTNTLVLRDSTFRLGGGALGGTVTNRGIIQAMGTITGIGTTRALVRNENLLDIGGSIGKLTLNNANLDLAAGSKTLFEFGESSLDQIVVNGGSASLLGTNQFTIVGPGPVPGVKYGLGVYDFVIGSAVTNSPQYDNLVNLLTNTYHLTYGVDFTYGVAPLNGGLFALELVFVPEPSTVLLLALGGLLVWRRMTKRPSKRE